MKAKTILTTIAVLAFLSAQPANAQLGNMVNKAKQKAKEAVENTAKSVKNNTVGNVEEKAQTAVEQPQAVLEQPQAAPEEQKQDKPKPTEEAIAADELALSEEILPGYTKPIGEIHALYETLDHDTYPIHPYYVRPNTPFYFMHTDLSNKLQNEYYYEGYRKKADEFWGSTFEDTFYAKMDDGYYVTGADKAINAGFALFRCDPEGLEPYKHYLASRCCYYALWTHFMKYMVTNENDRQIRSKDAERKLLRESATETARRWHPEVNRLDEIVRTKTPLPVIEEAVNYYHDLVKKNIDDNDFHIFDWWQYEWVVEHLKTLSQEGKGTDLYKKHSRYLEDWKEYYDAFTRKGNEKFNPIHKPIKTADIPAAKAHDAALEAQMINLAKGFYNDGRVPVKALIISPQWEITRNAFGAIIDRTRSANIIFRMADKSYRLVNLNYKQVYSGGSYGKTQIGGVGMTDSLISDYKE